uniref:hypothetical protein n=1 Tax=Eubacterium sp. TaxID=142586 RepID=UPI003FEF03B5
ADDFLQSKAQNAVNPFGLTSILTKLCEKSANEKLVRFTLACLCSRESNPICLKRDAAAPARFCCIAALFECLFYHAQCARLEEKSKFKKQNFVPPLS